MGIERGAGDVAPWRWDREEGYSLLGAGGGLPAPCPWPTRPSLPQVTLGEQDPAVGVLALWLELRPELAAHL